MPSRVQQLKNTFQQTQTQVLTSTIMLIFAFYTSFASSLLYMFMYSFYDLSPSTANGYNWFTTLNFLLRPIYGFLTDKYPIFGQKRKYYLFIYLTFLAVIWIAITIIQVKNLPIGSLIGFMVSASLAEGGLSAVTEGIMVEQGARDGKNSTRTKGLGFYFLMDGIGLLVSGELSGKLTQWSNTTGACSVVVALVVAMFLPAFIIKEKKRELVEDKNKKSVYKFPLKEECIIFYRFVTQKTIWPVLVFVLMFNLQPSNYDAMYYYQLSKLNFSWQFEGTLATISNAGVIFGILLYTFYFSKKSFKFSLIAATVLRTTFCFLQLIIIFQLNEQIHISNKAYAGILGFLTSMSQELQLMPILNLSCMICPKNSEAFIFETIMMLKDAQYSISYRVGGYLTKDLNITRTQFDNLWILQLIYTLFPVVEIFWLSVVTIKKDYKEEILKAQEPFLQKKEECFLNQDCEGDSGQIAN